MKYVLKAPDLKTIAAQVGVLEKDIQAACRRAVAKTARWAKTTGAAELAKVTQLAPTYINGRVGLKMNLKDGGYATVFFGLDRFSLSRLKPRQDSAGITAGPVRIEGAFNVRKGGVPTGALTDKWKKIVFKRKGKSRLPISKQSYDIAEVGERAIAASVFPRVEQKFAETFEQELQWLAHPKST